MTVPERLESWPDFGGVLPHDARATAWIGGYVVVEGWEGIWSAKPAHQPVEGGDR